MTAWWQAKNKEWMSITKWGQLGKHVKIKSLEEMYLFSLPIKESEMIDCLLGTSGMKFSRPCPCRSRSGADHACAGQHTRSKAFVATGSYNGHISLGVKCSKEVATAVRGVTVLAKLPIVPMQRGC